MACYEILDKAESVCQGQTLIKYLSCELLGKAIKLYKIDHRPLTSNFKCQKQCFPLFLEGPML